MQENNQLRKIRKKVSLAIVGILLVSVVMLLLLWSNVANSYQSLPAFFPDIHFEGEYKIADGEWNTVAKGKHIPATQGDVTLKGRFHLTAPDGEYLGVAGADVLLAFYVNHIQIAVYENGQEPYVCDIESAHAGKDLCGELYTGYTLVTDEPVTLVIHNNHRFGNETAIDDFLQELAIYADRTFETELVAQGDTERNAGLLFMIVAFILLGTALFTAFFQVEGGKTVAMIGLCFLFAGGYFIYGAKGVYFWSDSVVGNTTILGGCMMMYMLCICALITSTFKEKLHKIATAATIFMGAVCAGLAILCLVTDTYFYDTWLWWVIIQSIVNAVLLVCIAFEFSGASKGKIAYNIGKGVLLLGFEADVLGIAMGWWNGGLVCRYIFFVLFLVALVMIWVIMPRNIKAARRVKEMEAQLQKKQLAIMMSQIQPHFIYNTLGTIQQFCKEDPEQAASLVQNFSQYLRGNFSELDNAMPIRFTKELEHVRCYTEIELIRFPDMTVRYDIQVEEFLLPALSVQPLVENAIKHGLMGLEEGGCVTITAYETATHYCVKVVDDGVGFDDSALLDERKHIGIRNVQDRLQVMCGGSLTVESQPGSGTTALIQIPKEGKNA